MEVKLLLEDGELYVLVQSQGRRLMERGMRRRRLIELQGQSNSRDRLRRVRRREGRYLLRSNMTAKDRATLWHLHMQLTEIYSPWTYCPPNYDLPTVGRFRKSGMRRWDWYSRGLARQVRMASQVAGSARISQHPRLP